MDHISVCVCTYRRNRYLKNLLQCLDSQYTKGVFSYSIVVIDNCSNKTAETIVNSFNVNSKVIAKYYNEPQKNISLARNKALEAAQGDYIAFIDDDEIPVNGWLYNLFRTLKDENCQGVFGPVIPYYQGSNVPSWIVKGRYLERKSFNTGESISAINMRTGNVLFDKNMVKDEKIPFDPDYGLTGGEDGIFFRKMLLKNCRFVWCNEAVVYERINTERMTSSYFIRRALLRGVSEAKVRPISVVGVMKSIVAVVLYCCILPVTIILGKHKYMKYCIKICDHAGKLLALVGIKLVNERNFK